MSGGTDRRRAQPRARPGAGSGAGQGTRLVVGLHPVRELLRAGRPVHRILLAATREPSVVLDELLELARAARVPIEERARAALDEQAGGLVHQGVVAIAPPFAYASLDDLLRRVEAAGEPPILVALDGVTDPHNLGSIARTAEAVGALGLVVPSRRAASVTPAVEKAAAGALAHLPVAEVTNLVRALARLRDARVWSLGLDADGEVELDEHPLAGESCVLVVGAEGRGLSRLTRERCDALVRLPMRGRVDSLNASVAAGVALYTLLSHRR